MRKEIKLSIVYVYFNTPVEIRASLKSIPTAVGKYSYEIIIVDNNSTKKLPKNISSNKKVTIIVNSKNGGFGYGCNEGARKATGQYFLFLNPDTILSRNSISELVKTFEKGKKIGVVGPKMVDKKGGLLPTVNSFIKLSNSMVVYSFLNKFFPTNRWSEKFWLLNLNREKKQSVDVVSGACMLIKKEIFDKVGGFDERFFMYFEEQDICYRISKKGYKVIFNPRAVITHSIGASLSDKNIIKRYFQKSRFQYFRKHFGFVKAVLAESLLRFATTANVLLILSVLLSLFLNLYELNTHMLLIGDAARDFIAARDMILTGKLPLVGIPSSVVWLHQGPISVWLIGVSFLAANFSPIAPAILFGLIGAVTTGLVLYLGKILFNFRVGLIASLLYASAPFIVVNARMPYHTSLIPFFTTIFFILLLKTLKNKKLIPLLLFSFGLLLLVELSNVVVLGIILVVFLYFRLKLTKKDYMKGFAGLFIGIAPFIMYELVSGPSYLKFPLWIANRIRLFFVHGVKGSEPSMLNTTVWAMYQEITAAIVPSFPIVSIIIFFLGLVLLFLNVKKAKKNKSYFILLVWLVLPLTAFALHASPGQAYFTLLFPGVSLLVGYLLVRLLRSNFKALVVLVMGIVLVNSVGLIKNEFYVRTADGNSHVVPPLGYSLGDSWVLANAVSSAIVKDAHDLPFTIIGAGNLAKYPTSIDPYIYLTWYKGGRIEKQSSRTYTIYQEKELIPKNAIQIYSGVEGSVTKNE